MKRSPRARRSIRPPRPEHLWSGSGTWLAGGMAALHAAFDKLVTDFTDHLTDNAITELQIAGLTVGDHEATAVRDAIRALVTEKLLEALRLTESETEPNVMSRLRVTTTHEMLVELLTGHGGTQ